MTDRQNVFVKVSGNMKKLLALATIVVFTFVMTSCSLLPKEDQVMAPPIKKPDKVTYNTVAVKKGTIEKQIRCFAHFISTEQENVFFRRGGYLKKTYVKIGDVVKKGDILAELDTDDLDSQIRDQKLALDRAEVSLKQVRFDGQVELKLAGLRVQSLKQEYQRLLSAGDSVSRKELEDISKQLDEATIQLTKVQGSYGSADGKNPGYSLVQAQLNVEDARNKLNELIKTKEDNKVLASISGKVIYIDEVEEGEYVNPYKTLVRVADPTKMQLEYSEDRVSEFGLGMKVKVGVNNKDYDGEVVMTPADMPKNASDNLKASIRVAVNKLPPEVKIGDSAVLTLTQEKQDNTIVLPKNVVKNFGSRWIVHVLKDGVRTERDVELGIQTNSEVEVVKGLQEGEQVIVN